MINGKRTMFTGFDPNQIEDDNARQAIIWLLNLVEELKSENGVLREEVQQLRDENNRLKGEQGQPDVKPNKAKKNQDHSSEKERRRPKQWRKGSKVDKIEIDREEQLVVDKEVLPADAQFKGYEPVVVQDIDIKTDNVRFWKEKYYAPSTGKSYLASLPAGYEGEFGPGLRALVITLYYASEMTEPKIIEFLSHFGLSISAGQVSNLLTKKNAVWHTEKDEIYQAGLASSSWQHIDDTSTRVDGQNQYCHVLGNPLYTAYFTRPRKDRLTIIEILQNVAEAQFLLNEQTVAWLETFAIPHWTQRTMAQWPHNVLLSYAQFEELVNSHLNRLNEQQQARVFEAAALSAYHNQRVMPIVSLLLSDDAPQFKSITDELALCWVHEGRHYKKLTPCLDYHGHLLVEFRTEFWQFYHQLQRYRASPSPQQATVLSQTFDTLFSTVTGYDALDQRIAKTKAKKENLLMVLSHPEIPLHNNPAELGARQRVRKRDISFGPRSSDGTASWDTFMTLVATAKKLKVSFFAYIYDRVSGVNALPSLAETIKQRSPAFHPIVAELAS
jgi:regulator of replication initiation timing